MENKPQYIIIHHSASIRDNTNHKMIDRWHEQKGFPKSELGYFVGYHYVITANGLVKQTRNDNESGAHAKTDDGMNYKSIGICLTGNFETEQPSSWQITSLLELIEKLPPAGSARFGLLVLSVELTVKPETLLAPPLI